MENKKQILLKAVLTAFTLAILVSCASLNESAGVTGIWKYEDEYGLTYITLTPDGLGVLETWQKIDGEKVLTYVDFGPYTDDGEELSTPWSDYSYVLSGSRLTLSGEEFRRTSRTARNNTSAGSLGGVWKDSAGGLVGMTRDGFVISNISRSISGYSADDASITFDNAPRYDAEYAIVNNKLYIYDRSCFLNNEIYGVFTRETSGGSDTSTRANLIGGLNSNGTWVLSNINNENSLSIYDFKSDGSYTCVRMDYSTMNQTGSSRGDYTLDGHIVRLSQDSDLTYAFIDGKPFMFTY